MGLGSPVSFVISLLICILIFSAMQMYKQELAGGEWKTIVGGFLGSWLFVFSLTAMNNLENTLFGDGFQSQLLPEDLRQVTTVLLNLQKRENDASGGGGDIAHGSSGYWKVALALAGSLFACSLIHRVCVTTCFIFSMIALYYLNALSTEKYSAQTVAAVPATPSGKKKRH